MKAEMAEQVALFPEKYGRVPHLVVILVGEDPASQSYVRGKGKACEVVGIRNTTILRPASISTKTASSRLSTKKKTWTDSIR